MRFASLGSGSKGNATLVAHGETRVLVDCGFSAQEATRRLQRLGVEPAQLSAVLVTHEHSDHIGGVGALARRFDLPVYLSEGTYASGRLGAGLAVEMIKAQRAFRIGEIEWQPVAVPHDANEPCQFIAHVDEEYLGLLTDLGSFTESVESEYAICTALMLEANHDLEMLARGPYPPSLKRRVGGHLGHLNNEQAREFLHGLRDSQLHTLVLAHLSETNNSLDKVRSVFAECEAWFSTLRYANQQGGFDWIVVQDDHVQHRCIEI